MMQNQRRQLGSKRKVIVRKMREDLIRSVSVLPITKTYRHGFVAFKGVQGKPGVIYLWLFTPTIQTFVFFSF